MIINEVEFVASNGRIDKLPEAKLPEYAFIGRSNVGKSSLINMLTAKKGLARTSSKPGKTITMNHYIINNEWYLVDLPGYGYAKRSRSAREQWRVLMEKYLQQRRNLVNTFILVDARIEPQASDLEMMEWMGSMQLPFVVVFTKTDKLGSVNLQKALSAYKKKLLLQWEELPLMMVTSSETAKGKDELLQFISANNALFQSTLVQ